MEVVELKVRLHCKACEKTVRKALCNLKGVRCVQIDRGSSSSPSSSSSIASKITVMGYMGRKEVVRAVLKTGRKVQLLLPPPAAAAAMAPMMSITDDRIMEAASPKLPRGGFRCIIPQCARFYKSSRGATAKSTY
ncbi:unnamed protein product [Linum tenue]|uniref:HMA domain-containing protein n=1 Tax=Linum tenue TaxID=586396 RepID=A0AAV0R7B2_9ROSI|nr:unnamed protein product [Linum tenue]